jgi:predicted tellurium resistance membrane protein TerC
MRRPRPTTPQIRREAPPTRRARVIWWGIIGAVVLGGVLLILLTK